MDAIAPRWILQFPPAQMVQALPEAVAARRAVTRAGPKMGAAQLRCAADPAPGRELRARLRPRASTALRREGAGSAGSCQPSALRIRRLAGRPLAIDQTLRA
jgi:hypothetical protein